MQQRDFISALKFVSFAMAKNDVRYYINGVCIDVAEGTTTLVATNGAMLAAIEVLDCTMDDAGQYILPRDFVTAVLKNYKHGPRVDDPFFVTVKGQWVTTGNADLRISGQLLDGRYPDWRRVLPEIDRNKGKPKKWLQVGFNAELLATFAKAIKPIAQHEQLVLDITTENDAARIQVPINKDLALANARGAIMPMKL